MITIKNFFKLLSVGALTFTAACSDNKDFDDNGIQNTVSTGLVSFTLQTEGNEFGTRGPVYSNFSPSLSRGNLADVLIFAIYEKQEDGNYKLNSEYRNNALSEDIKEGDKTVLPMDPTSQNLIKWYTIEGKKLIKFDMHLDPDKEYKIVTWSQNSSCKAFDTTDLTNVVVKYGNALNNDELRDAFCAYKEFKGNDPSVFVTLYRPFAQINVGTTGADLKTTLEHAVPGKPYLYSQVKVTGVANTIDVLNDKIGVAGTEPVTFEYNTIPSYWNWSNISNLTAKNYWETIVYDKKLAPEEFLLVDLDGKEGYLQYQTYYPTLWWFDGEWQTEDDDKWEATSGEIVKKGDPRTETFKYLSMTYVLVPGGHYHNNGELISEEYGIDDSGNVNYEKKDAATVNLEVAFKTGLSSTHVSDFSLKNVPVKRNWRTNILGGLTMSNPNGTPDDPLDPDDPWNPEDPDPVPTPPNNPDPDDPTPPTPPVPVPPTPDTPDPDDPNPDPSIFNMWTFRVIIDNKFSGEYNGYLTGETGPEDDRYEGADWNENEGSANNPETEDTTE
ncbi:MAG: hypothetical protein J1F12_00975 [Muribaculaceae bacterium]|nr:hypothetical protein [Muribaculaceae bacterium]